MRSEGKKYPVDPESPTALIVVELCAWCQKGVDDGDYDEEEVPM